MFFRPHVRCICAGLQTRIEYLTWARAQKAIVDSASVEAHVKYSSWWWRMHQIEPTSLAGRKIGILSKTNGFIYHLTRESVCFMVREVSWVANCMPDHVDKIRLTGLYILCCKAFPLHCIQRGNHLIFHVGSYREQQHSHAQTLGTREERL